MFDSITKTLFLILFSRPQCTHFYFKCHLKFFYFTSNFKSNSSVRVTIILICNQNFFFLIKVQGEMSCQKETSF